MVNFLLTNSYASGKFLMLLSAVVVIIAVLALFIKELRSTKLFCSLGLAAGSLTVIALSIIALEVLWPLMGLADIGKDYLATHTHLAGLTLIVGVLAIFACSLSVGLYSMIEILKMLKSRRKNK